MAVFEDIVESVKVRIGNRVGLEPQIRSELMRIQDRLEAGITIPSTGQYNVFFPWFLLSEKKTNTTSPDRERVLLPTDFIAEYEEGALYLTENGRRIPLEKRSLNALNRPPFYSADDDYLQYQANAPGVPRPDTPRYYAITNRYIRLFPVPTREWPLEIIVYSKAPRFEPNSGNVWFDNAAELVIAEVALKLVIGQSDRDKISLFAETRNEEAWRLYNVHTQRMVNNYDYVKGEIEDIIDNSTGIY